LGWWRKPRRVFLNSMSDLWHDAVSTELTARVFAVIAVAEQHTFQVLTRRPGRMLGPLRQGQPGPGSDAASVAAVPLDPMPGLANLDQLAVTTTAVGVRVDVRWHGQRRPLPPEIDLSAFRIVQEAVTNVVRHAGTDRCQVCVDYQDDELVIEVLDDGRGGTTTAGAGYGLVGMRERVGLLHGEFSAGTRPEGGFRVTARLPLPEEVR